MTLDHLRQLIQHHRDEASRYEAAAFWADSEHDSFGASACRKAAQFHASTVVHLTELADAFGSMLSPSSEHSAPATPVPASDLVHRGGSTSTALNPQLSTLSS